jgi:hypothetical protein
MHVYSRRKGHNLTSVQHVPDEDITVPLPPHAKSPLFSFERISFYNDSASSLLLVSSIYSMQQPPMQIRVYNMNSSPGPTSFNLTVDMDEVVDVVWTPKGNIIYTKSTTNIIVIMSKSGELITKVSSVPQPHKFSVWQNDIIYLAANDGIYGSVDDGVTWKRVVFRSTRLDSDDRYIQAIKVAEDLASNVNVFWTLIPKFGLSMHTVDKKSSDVIAKYSVPCSRCKKFSESCYMVFDQQDTLFMNDGDYTTVHAFSVSKRDYIEHIKISSNHFTKTSAPLGVGIDSKRCRLYVACSFGRFMAFNLNYA